MPSHDTPERWLPVLGYEDWYEVSDLGRFRRIVATPGTRAGRILKGCMRTDGYWSIALHTGPGMRKTFNAHRLVIASFVGPCPDGFNVHHKNFVRADNRLVNLEYVPHKANIGHSVTAGRRASGERHPMAKLTEADVRTIRALLPTLPVQRLAERFGVTIHTIYDIKHGNHWKHVAP
jgi:hypothetical protein